jgi:hypothetical protein
VTGTIAIYDGYYEVQVTNPSQICVVGNSGSTGSAGNSGGNTGGSGNSYNSGGTP